MSELKNDSKFLPGDLVLIQDALQTETSRYRGVWSRSFLHKHGRFTNADLFHVGAFVGIFLLQERNYSLVLFDGSQIKWINSKHVHPI